MNSDKRLAWAAWIAVCFFWGTGFLAMRIGVQTAPPLLFAGLRILAAGILLLTWLLWRGHILPARTAWPTLAIIGVFTEGIANGALSWAAQWLSSGLLALLISMTPFWMVGVEAMLPRGERPTLRVIIGLIIGFAGLAWLIVPQIKLGESGPLIIGTLLMQGVCLCIAVGAILTRRRRTTAGPMMEAALQMVFAGAALIIAGSAAGEWPRMHFDTRSMAAFIYLMIFGSILAYSAYVYALQNLPISVVSSHRYINTAVAVFLGWALLGEQLALRDIAAILLIFAGVLLVRKRDNNEQAETPDQSTLKAEFVEEKL